MSLDPIELVAVALSVGWPLLSLLAMAGWGHAAQRLCRPSTPPADLLLSIVLGIVVVTSGAVAINFFYPLGTDPGRWTVGLGLVGYALALRAPAWRAQTLLLLVSTALATFLLFGRRMTFTFDAGLYHVPHMNWIAMAPTPPGLANLSGRLGFNSAWLPFVSALRWDDLFGWRNVFHAEIAMRAWALAWLLWRMRGAWLEGRGAALRLYVAALVAFALARPILGSQNSIDHAANLCALLAWVAYAELAMEPKAPARAWSQPWAALIALAALAVAIKLSMLPVALLPLFALAGVAAPPFRAVLRPMLPLLALLTVFALLLAARGIVTSGCIAYPATATCFRVPWGVPFEDVWEMSAMITGWARQPDMGYLEHASFGYWGWLGPWLPRFLASDAVRLLEIAAIGYILAELVRRMRGAAQAPRAADRAGTGLFLACAFAFWFLMAPDPRFCWGFFAITAAALVRPGLWLVRFPDPARAHELWARYARWKPAVACAALALLASLQWPPVYAPPAGVGPTRTSRNGVSVLSPRWQQCFTLPLCSPDPVGEVDIREDRGHWTFMHARAARQPITSGAGIH